MQEYEGTNSNSTTEFSSCIAPQTAAGRRYSEIGLGDSDTLMLASGEPSGADWTSPGVFEQLNLPSHESDKFLQDSEFVNNPKVTALLGDPNVSNELREELLGILHAKHIREQDRPARRHRRAVRAEVIKQETKEVFERIGDNVMEIGIALKPAIDAVAEFSSKKAQQIGDRVLILALNGWENANKLAGRKLKAGLKLSKMVIEKEGLIADERQKSEARISFICTREIIAAAGALPQTEVELSRDQLEAKVKNLISEKSPKLVDDPHFLSALSGFSNDSEAMTMAFQQIMSDPDGVREAENTSEVRDFMANHQLKPTDVSQHV
ncbi:MAG TPA: hypothetical protein VLF79_02490 [Candidatus Saccharimonadales bacterium]|nr:hypothetical protein [Candidatus Saccharimonadales bacterium]